MIAVVVRGWATVRPRWTRRLPNAGACRRISCLYCGFRSHLVILHDETFHQDSKGPTLIYILFGHACWVGGLVFQQSHSGDDVRVFDFCLQLTPEGLAQKNFKTGRWGRVLFRPPARSQTKIVFWRHAGSRTDFWGQLQRLFRASAAGTFMFSRAPAISLVLTKIRRPHSARKKRKN